METNLIIMEISAKLSAVNKLRTHFEGVLKFMKNNMNSEEAIISLLEDITDHLGKLGGRYFNESEWLVSVYLEEQVYGKDCESVVIKITEELTFDEKSYGEYIFGRFKELDSRLSKFKVLYPLVVDNDVVGKNLKKLEDVIREYK